MAFNIANIQTIDNVEGLKIALMKTGEQICDPSRRNGHVGGMTPNWVIDTSLKSIS